MQKHTWDDQTLPQELVKEILNLVITSCPYREDFDDETEAGCWCVGECASNRAPFVHHLHLMKVHLLWLRIQTDGHHGMASRSKSS